MGAALLPQRSPGIVFLESPPWRSLRLVNSKEEGMKNRSGLSLIEVMIAVMVLSFAVATFAPLYPISMRMRSKAENVSRATALAQQKIEQVRALPYTSLTYSSLQTTSVIDASPSTSPYSFTSVDGLASKLPQGTGTLTLSTPATDLKRVDVTITWGGLVQNGNTVTVSTQVANKAVKAR
jgi:prepilin-type N-terminal cleavage/methylation domain-containing protein